MPSLHHVLPWAGEGGELHFYSFKDYKREGHWQPQDVWLCRGHCLSRMSQHLHVLWGQVLHRHWHWPSSPQYYLKGKGSRHSHGANVLSFEVCANHYADFHYELREASSYLSGTSHLSDFQLFWMFHACTVHVNVDLSTTKMSSLRVLQWVIELYVSFFSTTALVMGLNLKEVNTVIHYTSPNVWKSTFMRVVEDVQVVEMLCPQYTVSLWTVQ